MHVHSHVVCRACACKHHVTCHMHMHMSMHMRMHMSMPANQATQRTGRSRSAIVQTLDSVASNFGRALRLGYRTSPCVLTQHPRLSSHRNSPLPRPGEDVR